MKKLTAIFAANRDYALISSSAVLIERLISSGWQVVLAAEDDAENQAFEINFLNLISRYFSLVTVYSSLFFSVFLWTQATRKFDPYLSVQIRVQQRLLN
jgi:hypothetical protein